MTAENFPACLALILKEEGGNDDDPRDHGGRTSRGITQSEWDTYLKSHAGLPADVWQAPQSDVEAIYHAQYWAPYCDRLPVGIDLEFFNTAINSGRQQAVKELQRALGVTVDGMMGMQTFAAVDSIPDRAKFIHILAEQRRKFYRALKQFSIYGKGWMARTDRIERAALQMVPPATVAVQPDVMLSAKAPPTDSATPPVDPQKGMAVTAGSGLGATLVPQLQDAAGQLSPFADTIIWIKYILVGVAVVGFGFTVYGLWHNSKIKEAIG